MAPLGEQWHLKSVDPGSNQDTYKFIEHLNKFVERIEKEAWNDSFRIISLEVIESRPMKNAF